VFQLCGGENREKGWTGMGHLPWGDVREAPTTERSFLAGETERVFEITNWNTRNVMHHDFGDAYVPWLNIAYSGGLYYTTFLFFGD